MHNGERKEIAPKPSSQPQFGSRQQTESFIALKKIREPVYDSHTLFGSSREIRIEHAGETYRLKITKLGKLILNK
ncbi:MAG: hemin uptake protein HemP [Hyphomicrobiales bacterium]